MNKKAVRAMPYAETAEAVADLPTSVTFVIKGMREVRENTFELSGVHPRNIDWESVASAMGFEEMPDRLMDAIADTVFRHDLVEILTDRIAT